MSLTFQAHVMNSRRFGSTIILSFIIFATNSCFIIFHNTIKIFKLFTNNSGCTIYSIFRTTSSPYTLVSEFDSTSEWRISFIINNSDIWFCHIKVINSNSVKSLFGFRMIKCLQTMSKWSILKFFKSRLYTNTDDSSCNWYRIIIKSRFTKTWISWVNWYTKYFFITLGMTISRTLCYI